MIPKFTASRPLEQPAASNRFFHKAELIHHSNGSMVIRGMSANNHELPVL
jgi:hypothetical protein